VTLYVLDTDHVSMWLENQLAVRHNVIANQANLAITIVTVQEIFNGWIGRLNNPAEAKNQVYLYGKLSKVVAYLQGIRVLDFDEASDQTYRQLLTNYPALRKSRIQKDMKIAAITIANNATFVTRNYRDFSQVPNFTILDWSV
jgi:tRNA(fMet)-specific endonuclease VapC